MFRRTFFFLAVIALSTTACSGGDLAEQVLEGQDDVGDVEIDENDGSISVDIEGEDGGSATIGGGDLPDDLPFGVPDGGEVLSVFSSNNNETQLGLKYPAGTFDSLKEHFASEIDDGGFEIVTTAEQPGAAINWNLTRGEGGMYISINAGQDAVLVSLVYGDLE